MSLSLKLSLCFTVLITWMKAGHADGYASLALLTFGTIILLIQISKFRLLSKRKILICIPIFYLVCISITGWFNPTYRTITVNDIEQLKFNEAAVKSKDAKKIEMISNAVNFALDKGSVDPSAGLSIFFYFKNTYLDKFNPDNNDSLLGFLNAYERKIKLTSTKYLPTCTIANLNNLKKFYLQILILFIGIITFYSIKDRSDIRNSLLIILLNCFLLTLVGFYQKYIHEWSDNYNEILGIWNAPEPRYYFSTFSYKNHWSAYAILVIFCNLFLLKEDLFRFSQIRYSRYFSRYRVSLTAIFIITSSSIFFSGSRSGILILSFTFIYLIIINLKRILLYFKSIFFIKYFFLFLPLLITVIYIFSHDNKWEEIKNNSSQQWQNLTNGKPPLRFYLWLDSVKMIKERPFWGHGYNSFSSIYSKYQSKEVRLERGKGLENAHKPYVPLVAHAHSDILESVIEWGLVGCFISFLPFIFILFTNFLSHPSTPTHLLSLGCLAFLLYCFIDFPTRTPACLATFVTVFAIYIKSNSLKKALKI